MTDETKAGIVSGIVLAALGFFCAEPNGVRLMLLLSVIVIMILYMAYDYRSEQKDRRIKRLIEDDSKRLRDAEK